MKKKLYCTLAIWLFLLPAYCISLQNAIAEKKVAVSIRGVNADEIPTGVKYAPKITFVIENLAATPLKIEMEEGYILQPDKNIYQPYVLAEPMVATLAPKQKNKQAMVAYCMDLSKSSPSATTTFTLGKKANDGLYQFIKWANSAGLQNYAIQDGVWSFTNAFPVMSIDGGDNTMTERIQRQCASLQKINFDTLKMEYQSRKNSEILSEFNGKKLDRNIVFHLDSNAVIAVAYFRSNGEPIATIRDSTLLLAGSHAVRYNPFPISLSNQRYSVRLLVNGTLTREYFYRQ